MHTVGEVATLTGVTVRALHHYETLGLLCPTGRSDAGYRLYDGADLERLQEIVVWRALGFPLAEIKALLDDPEHDRGRALAAQRALIEAELERLRGVAAAVDRAHEAHRQGGIMDAHQLFGGFDPSAYEAEAQERWGHTEAYRESARRTARYGEAEWGEIRAEAEAIEADFARLLAAGEPPDGEAAQAVAERHGEHLTRWFYAVSPDLHRNLGEMYVADPRFAAHYEARAAGLAAYVRDAIVSR